MTTATIEPGTTTMIDESMTIREAARVARVQPDTLWGWIKHGCAGVRLSARMVGGRWRVRREDLDAFFAARTAAAVGRVEAEQAACGEGSAVGSGGGTKERRRGLREAQERLRRRGI